MKTIYSWRPEKKFRPPDRGRLTAFAAAAAEAANSGIVGILSVSWVSERKITAVNTQYVGHTGPTDVICFDYRETRGGLAAAAGVEEDVEVELIVSPAAAARAAAKRALPYSRELALYLVHGLLHAAGVDDLTPKAKRIMRRKEAAALRILAKKFNLDTLFPAPVQTPEDLASEY